MHHIPENYPLLGHALVAANTLRLQAFVEGYAQFAEGTFNADSTAEESYTLLQDLFYSWEVEDHTHALADVVTLAGEAEGRTKRALKSVLDYLGEDASMRSSILILTGALTETLTLPRVRHVQLQRCLQRFQRVLQLRGPGFVLFREAEFIATQLEGWKQAPERVAHTWCEGSSFLLLDGLLGCMLRDERGIRGAHLGLPLSPRIHDLLPMEQGGWQQVLEHSLSQSLETHCAAVAAFPFVPRGRFHTRGPLFSLVPDHGEGTGPIGWALGEELSELKTAYEALARKHPEQAAQLREIANQIERVQERGEAVLGCLELMTYEGDGQRNWLVHPNEDTDPVT